MCVTRHDSMRKLSISDKEELYDVIAALSATLRELTKEIVELQGIQIRLGDKVGYLAFQYEEMMR